MSLFTVTIAWLHGRSVGRRERREPLPDVEYETVTGEPVPGPPAEPVGAFLWLALLPVWWFWSMRWHLARLVLYLVLAWVCMMAFIGPLILAVDHSPWWLLLYIPVWLILCALAVLTSDLTRTDGVRYSEASNQPEES